MSKDSTNEYAPKKYTVMGKRKKLEFVLTEKEIEDLEAKGYTVKGTQVGPNSSSARMRYEQPAIKRNNKSWYGSDPLHWVLPIILGVVFYYWLSNGDENKGVKKVASSDEIIECKARIEDRFDGDFEVDVYFLTGQSSDKNGPGGTSRVRLYFDLKDSSGDIAKMSGICQFSSDADKLIVTKR
ncbi:hypothetical protein [Vibrio casei]|uniref:Uncharacterized protein n=1 Tax=Vibrio casei TaxID=673372 RepID=A0A368LHE6_9VIBR|nr:hypothetical protein [Vibrio casei]RCS70179.1 hypothetical protein CIK83_11995 [Vibrio casei]